MNQDIVLISGALASSSLWHHQEKHFHNSKQFHYVDVLNCDSIEEMANRFVPISPKKFTLIGFSMGGYVALELLRHIPDSVDKLILINSAAKLVSEKGQLERERSLDLIDRGKFDFLVKLIFKNSIYDSHKYDLLLPQVQAMAHEVGVENYKKQLNAILNKPDHTSLLSSIKCPALILASQQDKVMPIERSQHLANHIKHSELIYLEGCGHMAMLEQPDMINQILAGWL